MNITRIPSDLHHVAVTVVAIVAITSCSSARTPAPAPVNASTESTLTTSGSQGATTSSESPPQSSATGANPSRRARAADVDALPIRNPGQRISYGNDSLQFGDLRLPAGLGPFPVVVVIHGGCWYSPYADVRNSAPMAEALANAGMATWNVEYRRYDQPGGGWPGTFRDVSQAANFVRELAKRFPLDTTRIVAVGHSAGGQLALWLTTRSKLATGSELRVGSPVQITGVVSIGGIPDLREYYERERKSCGNPAVESLLGGAPMTIPERVQEASPIERLPLGAPTVLVHGALDAIANEESMKSYLKAARWSGDSVELVTIPGEGHFESIMPLRRGGQAVIDATKRLIHNF